MSNAIDKDRTYESKPNRLVAYVKDCLRKGHKLAALRRVLLNAGYSDEDIKDALFPGKKEENKKVKGSVGQWVKDNKPLVFLFVALQIVLVLVVFLVKTRVPTAYFLEANTGEFQIGDVYFDGRYLGHTTGKFDALPSDYCKSEHTIEFRALPDIKVSWDSDPSDCKLKIVKYSFTRKKVKVAPEPLRTVTLNFTTSDLAYLSGTLRFDSKTKAFIVGQYVIAADECMNVSYVELLVEKNNTLAIYSWQNDPANCASDAISFIGQMDNE